MSAANTDRSFEALLCAARTEHDFAGWLAQVLARVAGQLGSSDALVEGRPGSWEADLVDRLVKGTVGYDDKYLPGPVGKLTDAQVRDIRWRYYPYGGVTQAVLAAEVLRRPVVFGLAKFCGGTVIFAGAEFSAGEVNFAGAEFSAGSVDFGGVANWSGPPMFDFADNRPTAVQLPPGHVSSRRGSSEAAGWLTACEVALTLKHPASSLPSRFARQGAGAAWRVGPTSEHRGQRPTGVGSQRRIQGPGRCCGGFQRSPGTPAG